MANKLPSQEYLKECFDYDEKTGILTWRERPMHHHKLEKEVKRFNTKYAGKEAGRVTSRGYREVVIDKQYCPVHRVIFKWMTGREPTDIIDHINGDVVDNRWENLREATHTQNNHNRRISRNNTSGYKGVSSMKNGRYKSTIRIGENKRLFLGCFHTAEEAHDAYCEAARKHHKEFFNKG